MTKYSTESKIKIVSEYLNNKNSIIGLSNKYKIPYSVIRRWIHQAQENGIESLKVKYKKSTYSLDFKLNVIRYYLNNPSLGFTPVAVKFSINESQVYSWVKKFEKEGMAGLIPKQKGRLAKVPKKIKKKPVKKIELSQKQRYEEKIIKQEAEIERLKLENLVLKKVAARYPRYPTKKKQ